MTMVTCRHLRMAGRSLAIVGLLSGSLSFSELSVREARAAQLIGSVVVSDVTSESDCQIQISRVPNAAENDPGATTGSLECSGLASVVHTEFFPFGALIEQKPGDLVVELTGDSLIDVGKVERAIDIVGSLSARAVKRKPLLKEVDTEIGCQDGVAPSSYLISGSYLVYVSDGGPVDTRMRYQTKVRRVTCTEYELRLVASWLDDGNPSQQRLWFDQYRYSRAISSSRLVGSRQEGVCERHPNGSGITTRLEASPASFRLLPSGVFKIWTTNNGFDNCVYFGETWTGEVGFDLPLR